MTSKNPHFIGVQTDDDNDAHTLIKEKYDKLFQKKIVGDHIPVVYNEIKDYIDHLDITKEIPITISSDKTISVATICSLNQKFMKQMDQKFVSDLKIIYISDSPALETNESVNLSDFILSSLFGLTDEGLVKNKLILNPDQILMIGLRDKSYSDSQTQILYDMNIRHFMADRIKKNGIDKVIYALYTFADNYPVHVIINLATLSPSYAPSVIRHEGNTDGFTPQQLDKIIETLKHYNIVGLDIVGLNARIDTESKKASRLTAEIVRGICIQLFDIKEKKLNIYNENSKFLIYRPIEQINYENDIGWRILRNIPEELKETIISQVGNKIITIPIDDEDFFVTATTMIEQEQKSYYTAKTIYDTCLLPDEKKAMMFELISV